MNIHNVGLDINNFNSIIQDEMLKVTDSGDEISQIVEELGISKLPIDNKDEESTISTEKNDNTDTKKDEKSESEIISENIKNAQTELDNIKNTLDEKEKEYVEEIFGYPKGTVQYFGLPRMDNLHKLKLQKTEKNNERNLFITTFPTKFY